MPQLLVELFSEEIPARMQGGAARDLERMATERLKAAGRLYPCYETEEELDRVEQQLLDKDFDAILLTKVVGTERHTNLAQSLGEIGAAYERFSRDYVVHQDIYFDKAYYEAPTDYYTETSLYCICVGKERSLVWRNNILIWKLPILTTEKAQTKRILIF